MRTIGSYFPNQQVSDEEKNKAEWYENCIDYVISAGIAANDKDRVNKLLNTFHGNIPDEYYAKTLNPYNASQEKYKRYPATMRNLDLMGDVVRRYVSEYCKGIHEFIVTANNPDIVLRKNQKLGEAVSRLAQETFVNQLKAKIEEQVKQGTPQEEIDPSTLMPNIEEFIAKFNEDYIDDVSNQGQKLIKVIDELTEADIIYPKAYFDFITCGECYSYRDIRNGEFHKEIVPVLEAYPVPNNNFFAEDYDMFARRTKMSYSQVLDTYGKDLDDNQKKLLRYIYDDSAPSTTDVRLLTYDNYFESSPDSCSKFTASELNEFRNQPISLADVNGDLIDVWHATWVGYTEVIILTRQNEAGFIEEVVVPNADFKFNPELGHISYEKEYQVQVHEGVRIGTRSYGIYPIKSRAIAYNRKGKLPYNGIGEVLPNFGKFSVVDIIQPYQVLRNIISYHREMIIAKNKMLILLIAKSLLGGTNGNEEDTIYRMAAGGILPYDDSDDSNGVKAQQVRILNASMSGYIKELTDLMDSIKYEAREVVDMTPQRYGEIAQSAGKGTTQEAIVRGSMGSVIIVYMFDKFRERDYQADMDFTKLAWIDGLDTTIRTQDGIEYLSIDANSHMYADYIIRCKNNAKESEKVEQLRQWAFNASQNGDIDTALQAIINDNVSSIKKGIEKFTEIKRKHEADMQQAEQAIQQAAQEFKLKEIAAKGEEDRKTLALKAQYDAQSQYMDITSSMIQSGQDVNSATSAADKVLSESLEREKLAVENKRIDSDNYNKAADRNVKREDIQAKKEIAKTNRNKYSK